MSTGKAIDERLQKIMGATSHTRSNTAVEIDYAEAVKLYVEKMSRNGKPGVAMLGMDGTPLGTKDTPVTITVDYFMNPEVANIFKD